MSDGDRGAGTANAAKRQRLLAMLEDGIVMLHLDPRGPDVIVPTHLKVGPVLRLNIAYGFRLPALDIGDDGVYAVLSFNRQHFGCTIPWHAVFALSAPDDASRGAFFPESVPPELLAMLQSATERAAQVDDDRGATAPAAGARPTPLPVPALATMREDMVAGAEREVEGPPPTGRHPKPTLVVLQGGGTPAEGDATTASRPRPSLTIVKE